MPSAATRNRGKPSSALRMLRNLEDEEIEGKKKACLGEMHSKNWERITEWKIKFCDYCLLFSLQGKINQLNQPGMYKLVFSTLTFTVFMFANGQSLQSSEKGRDLQQKMEASLESHYGHDMKLTPSFEKGMNEYAHENANIPIPNTPFDDNAHYHTAMHFSPELFNQIDNVSLVKILTPNDARNEQVGSMLKIINPNHFYLEQYTLNNELYIVLALDRPFDYTTLKAEE
jgi:hypothetical protein